MGADVEADLRCQLGRDARSYVNLIRRRTTTVESAIAQLVARSFLSPVRLQDAAELLGSDHPEARALLTRAVRYAADPPEVPIAYAFRTSGASFVRLGTYLRRGVPAVQCELNSP